MNVKLLLLVAVMSLFAFLESGSSVQNPAPQNQLTVTAVNKLKITRESETIELTAAALAPLAEKDLMKLHVRDSAGKEVLSQAVDTDYDDYHKPDLLIFQADFAPGETKTFAVTAGKKREYVKEDFRAYWAVSHGPALEKLRRRKAGKIMWTSFQNGYVRRSKWG